MQIEQLTVSRSFVEGKDQLWVTFDFPEKADDVRVFSYPELPGDINNNNMRTIAPNLKPVVIITREAYEKSNGAAIDVEWEMKSDLLLLPRAGGKGLGFSSENILRQIEGKRVLTPIVLPNIRLLDRRFVKGKDSLVLSWDFPEEVSHVSISCRPSQQSDSEKVLLVEKVTRQDFSRGQYILPVESTETFDLFFTAYNKQEEGVWCEQNTLTNFSAQKIGLKNLQLESDIQFVDGRDIIKVSWLFPKTVFAVEIYSGHFQEVNWTDEAELSGLLSNSRLVKTVTADEAQQTNSRITLDVLEDEDYDLLFVPIDHQHTPHISRNVLLNNSKRRRIVYWRVEESPMPPETLKNLPLWQRLRRPKRCTVIIRTNEAHLIPKEALGIRMVGASDGVSQLTSDFSKTETLKLEDYTYDDITKDKITVYINDGYSGIVLRKED